MDTPTSVKDFAQIAHDNQVKRERDEKFETAYRKFCRGCSRTKPIEDFYKSDYHSGGYRPRCKVCVNNYTKESRKQEKVKKQRSKSARKRQVKNGKSVRVSGDDMTELVLLIKSNETEKALEILKQYGAF